jgi:hypothetical protein
MTMMKIRTSAAALALGLVLAVASAPVQARTLRTGAPGYAAHAQAIGGEAGTIARRDAALRACNAQANRYAEPTYGGDMPSFVYRACMTERGEAE